MHILIRDWLPSPDKLIAYVVAIAALGFEMQVTMIQVQKLRFKSFSSINLSRRLRHVM
jgi:hypothetical protein